MNEEKQVRLDKWLWAARFYKTRSLARQAVEGGKVRYNGSRAKPGKIVQLNAIISISKGQFDTEVVILDVNDKRGPATEARTLYSETEESRKRADLQREQRKLQHTTEPIRRPDKRQRRLIHRFRRQTDSD